MFQLPRAALVFALGLLGSGGLNAVASTAQEAASDPVARIGRYVEDYFSRAQSILVEELVVIQPLSRDLAPDGFARRATYELRVEWNPAAELADERAVVVRTLVSAAGPRLFDEGQEQCADPPTVTPEPLAFLLPANQQEWAFALDKPARVDGRAAMTLRYARREARPPAVVADGECLFTDLSGFMQGRLWVDASSSEILRMDEQLRKMVDIEIPPEHRKKGRPEEISYERVTTSIRYKPVPFAEPDEVLLLPATIESLQMYRSPTGQTRLRTTQTFTNYRRFMTAFRVLP